MSCYYHLTMEERKSLMLFLNQRKSIREIARLLHRSPSTVSRELRRNPDPYRATAAQRRYTTLRDNCVRHTILSDRELHKMIHFLLGSFWWSPEQISKRLKEEGTAQISASTIYRALEDGELQDTLRYYLRIKYRKLGKNKEPNKLCFQKLISLRPAAANALYGNDITQEEYDAAYIQLGLDKPILVRFVEWGSNFLKGEFGTSYHYHVPAMEIIGQKISITLYLSVVSTLISFPLGILLGVVTAVNRGKWQDTVITMVANLMSGIPAFVIAIVLLYIFSIKLKLLPTGGFTFPWEDFKKHMGQIIMPMICLCVGSIAGICRQTRSSMLEAIRQDSVRTANAKGLTQKVVLSRHVLRNGLIPVVTLIGNRLAYMIGGSVFVESVYSIPGMGTLMVRAVNDVDVPIIQACVVITAVVVSLAFLITDILYVVVDPRIRLK